MEYSQMSKLKNSGSGILHSARTLSSGLEV